MDQSRVSVASVSIKIVKLGRKYFRDRLDV